MTLPLIEVEVGIEIADDTRGQTALTQCLSTSVLRRELHRGVI